MKDVATTSSIVKVPSFMLAIMVDVERATLFMAILGALIFMLNTKELSVIQRIVYVPSAVAVGYFGASDIINFTGIASRGVASFIGAALSIVVLIKVMDSIQSISRKNIASTIIDWIASVISKFR